VQRGSFPQPPGLSVIGKNSNITRQSAGRGRVRRFGGYFQLASIGLSKNYLNYRFRG